MARELNIRIAVDDAEARAKLGTTETAIKGVERAGADASKRMEVMGGRLRSIGSTARSAGTAMTLGLTAPIVAVGGAAIKMAMDAVESENLFAVSFGNMATQARAWSVTTSKALGLNQFELRRTSALIFTMASSMGLQRDAALSMSQGMTTLAADMASFFNIRPEDAFEKLKSGIVGQTEPLRALGILVDETTTKQFALKNGFRGSWEEADQATKVMFRWQAILAQTSAAQGDLARTLDSPTNQLRIMRERMSEVSVQLGIALLPVFESFLGLVQRAVPWIEKAVQWFTNLPEPVRMVGVGVLGLVAALGPLLLGLGGLLSVAGTVISGLGTMGLSFGAVGTTIAAVATGPIGIAVAAIVGLGLVWLKWGDDIRRIVTDAYTAVKTWLWDKLEPVLVPVGQLIMAAGEMFVAFGKLVGAVVMKVIELHVKLVTEVTMWLVQKLQPIFAPLGRVISAIATVVGGMVSKVGTLVKDFYLVVKTWLVDKFVDIINSVREKVEAVTGFFGDMYDKVVGNSYVPDMVREIGLEFQKLGSLMVRPAKVATEQVTDTFRSMLNSIQGMFTGWGTSLSSKITNLIGGPIGGAMGNIAGQIVSGLGGLITGGITTLVNLGVQAAWQGIQWIGGKIKEFFNSPTRAEFQESFAQSLGFGDLNAMLNALMGAGRQDLVTGRNLIPGFGPDKKRGMEDWMDSVSNALGLQPSFARGTGGEFLNFGAGTRAMLHGDEAVVRRSDSQGLAEAIAEALGPRLGGGGKVEIHIGPRKLAEIIMPELPGVVQRWGMA